MNDPIGPDFFMRREAAVIAAIQLARTTQDVDLFECPTVEPPPAELAVVRACHARARSLGLTLPAFPSTTVQFVRAPEGLPVGAQTRRHGDVLEMVFVAGQPLAGLHRLALHELCHVHQLATGAWLSLSSADCEEQAEMFAWNALQGWRP
jgi:hypothetical protein